MHIGAGERRHARPRHGTDGTVASSGSAAPTSASPRVLAVPLQQHESCGKPRARVCLCRQHRRTAPSPPPYGARAQPRQMLYANAGVRVAWGRHGCPRGSLVSRRERAVLVLLARGSGSVAAAFSLAAGGSPLAGSERELAEASGVLSRLAFSRWLT